ncbi:MAG: hypothetical protein ACXABK_00560 [Candidatus Heimdallarchaeaceae archaeon]|jgi:flagellar biosynthesis protein FlhB
MSSVVEAIYLWDSKKVSSRKNNREFGNLISVFILFLYFLLFIFAVSGAVYPLLRDSDLILLGYKSGIVETLGYVANRWWLIFLLFLLSLIITTCLTFLLSKTRTGSFLTYIEFLKVDFEKETRLEVVERMFSDIVKISAFTIISFFLIEIITSAICSIAFLFVLPMMLSGANRSFGAIYLTFLITQIVIFPLIILLYQFILRRRMKVTSEIDLREYMNEEGEIDLEKWRKKTWGKKAYTFDWTEEEVFPITCFSCGAIISSDFTECPICNVDLIQEIEEIDVDYEVEDEKETSNKNIADSSKKKENK